MSLHTLKRLLWRWINIVKYAVGGIGKLTASGLSRRGHSPKDFQSSNNVGRGGNLWKFRNHILSNLPAAPFENTTKVEPTAQNTSICATVALSGDTGVMKDELRNELLASWNDGRNLFKEYDVDINTLESQNISAPTLFQEFVHRAATENLHFWIADSKDANSTWPAML